MNEETIEIDLSDFKEFRELVKAVAHIGVDFGCGKFELDEDHIKAARKLLERHTD